MKCNFKKTIFYLFIIIISVLHDFIAFQELLLKNNRLKLSFYKEQKAIPRLFKKVCLKV